MGDRTEFGWIEFLNMVVCRLEHENHLSPD
jgi:hypothetical protein